VLLYLVHLKFLGANLYTLVLGCFVYLYPGLWKVFVLEAVILVERVCLPVLL
jgi:hypothetical protein